MSFISCWIVFVPGNSKWSTINKFLQNYQRLAALLSLKMGVTTIVILSSPEAARESHPDEDKFLSHRWFPDNVRAHNHNEISLFLPSTNPLWKHLWAISTTYLFSACNLESTRAIREVKACKLVAYFVIMPVNR